MKPGIGTRNPGLGDTPVAAGALPVFADPRRHGACILACMHWTAAVSIAMNRPVRGAAGAPPLHVPDPGSRVPS